MDNLKVLTLNTAQNKALNSIKKYIESTSKHMFLLLGPAGSGKTTVIVNAFNGANLKICFCAFTNKATQVLKSIAQKFQLNFQSDFMTIHKLLGLEIKYQDTETEISFTFDKNKVINLSQYDVIIFDECSTISEDLYRFLSEAWDFIEFKCGKKLKYLFLGDFWQLPPVGEEKSIIFQSAIQNKWPVAKLDKVMRSANDKISDMNSKMLEWIPRFKENDVDDFVKGYPFNLVPRTKQKYLGLETILDKFLSTWHDVTPDTVILTYSRANCEKTNFAIQDRLDMAAGRELEAIRTLEKFYVGDRCCLDKPIDVHAVRYKQDKLSIKNLNLKNVGDVLCSDVIDLDAKTQAVVSLRDTIDDLLSGYVTVEASRQVSNVSVVINDMMDETLVKPDVNTVADPTVNTVADPTGEKTTDRRTVHLEESTGFALYNGEIFDVLEAEDVYIVTPLNRFQYMAKHFEGQRLVVRRIADTDVTYEILHIPEKHINAARKLIRAKERRLFYINIMSEFIKRYPKLDYGYCITIYKSQGSEWHTTFVNLNSIKWSIIGKGTVADLKKKSALFKTTYTALSRASTSLYCMWSN